MRAGHSVFGFGRPISPRKDNEEDETEEMRGGGAAYLAKVHLERSWTKAKEAGFMEAEGTNAEKVRDLRTAGEEALGAGRDSVAIALFEEAERLLAVWMKNANGEGRQGNMEWRHFDDDPERHYKIDKKVEKQMQDAADKLVKVWKSFNKW